MSQLLKSGAWITSRYLIVSLAGLILSLGFARLGSKEIFGQYQLILSLLSLFSIFSLPGLNMAALRSVANQKPRALLEAVGWSAKASLLASLLILGYGFYLIRDEQGMVGTTLVMASLFFPFFYAPNTWYVYYEGRSIFRPVAIRAVISSVVVTASVLVGLYFQLNLFWLVFIYLAVWSLLTGLFYLEVKQKIIGDKAKDQDLDLRYGLGVSVQKYIFTLSESLPPLAVGFLLGTQAVAGFQIANLFLGAIAGLIGALGALYLPRLFTDTASAHRSALSQNLLIGVFGAIGYWLVVTVLFLPLYGEAYRESYQLAQTLSLLPVVIALRSFLVNYLTAHQKNSLIVGIYLVANLIALVGFWFLARQTTFVAASAGYLYLLNISLLLPLIYVYLAGRSVPSVAPKVVSREVN